MTRTHFEDERNEANLPNTILRTYLNAQLSGRTRYGRLLTLALAYVTRQANGNAIAPQRAAGGS